MDLKAHIRDISDFPQPGILFRDITPLLGNAAALSEAIHGLVELVRPLQPEAIVGIESRGFIFGVPLADRMKLPFIPVRKPGKLPAARLSVEYSLEYGDNRLDIHEDALQPGQRAVVVDDLLATGGTALAAAKLVEMVGGVVAGCAFLIELEPLQGRKRLGGYPVQALLTYG